MLGGQEVAIFRYAAGKVSTEEILMGVQTFSLPLNFFKIGDFQPIILHFSRFFHKNTIFRNLWGQSPRPNCPLLSLPRRHCLYTLRI